MNVAFDPWIPVMTVQGQPMLASLHDVLCEGGRYADLTARPHERVAVLRLLMCVAHAAMAGPKDYGEWCRVPRRLPEAAADYLETWKESFEVFHPARPWLQVANLESGKDGEEGWGPVSKLGFYFASGANTTLFDHAGMDNASRNISLEETLLSLLTFQCFSPGGLIAQAFWASRQTGKSSKDAPCASASMAHAFIRGSNLLETVHANLPTWEDVVPLYADHGVGRPIWEQVPKSLDDAPAVRNATTTYLGRLVPLTRVVRLHPEGRKMLLGDGLPYPSFAEGFIQEPTATVVIRQKDGKPARALLSYRPGRAWWRELPSIMAKRRQDGEGTIGGPLTLRSLSEGQDCDLVLAALARDQATIVDTVEAVFHVPGRLGSEDGAAVHQAGVADAETTAVRLGHAIETYRETLDGGWEGRLKGAGANKLDLLARLNGAGLMHYWTGVEGHLDLLMAQVASLGTDAFLQTRQAWQTRLGNCAREAYEAVCGQETPRQIKAFAQGWKRLNGRPGIPGHGKEVG